MGWPVIAGLVTLAAVPLAAVLAVIVSSVIL